jgi:hypothetical protein
VLVQEAGVSGASRRRRPAAACALPLQSIGASRALIQTTLQDEVFGRNREKLAVRDGCRVSGLLWSEDGSRATGAGS